MNQDKPFGTKKIPVILDTDIGTDIDDTWALAFLLKCPELDVRLITTGTGDTLERAKITAKFLEAAGQSDIPIGIGLPLEDSPCYQSAWAKGYDLQDYPGMIYADGVGTAVDLIRNSPEPVTVIGISPFPNLAAALMYDPQIVKNSRFVGMLGSIRRGYFDKPECVAEYNVKLFPYACRKVLTSAWQKTIAPLDTCGILKFNGENYQRLRNSTAPMLKAVFENYDCWTEYNANPLYRGFNPEVESSILFDLLPVYLAFSEAFVEIEALRLDVTPEGFTRIEPTGSDVRCATAWRSLKGFEDLVLERLLAP